MKAANTVTTGVANSRPPFFNIFGNKNALGKAATVTAVVVPRASVADSNVTHVTDIATTSKVAALASIGAGDATAAGDVAPTATDAAVATQTKTEAPHVWFRRGFTGTIAPS